VKAFLADLGKLLVIALVSAFLGALRKPVAESPVKTTQESGINEVTLETLKKRLSQGAMLLDVRPRAFYQLGHLPGAISLPLAEIPKIMPTLSLEKTSVLLIYCTGEACDDSLKAALRLRLTGYSQVFVYKGGYEEWIKKGEPIEFDGAKKH